MPRRLMGDCKLTYFYACGKVVSMNERDALKMNQMHLKMCNVCKNALELPAETIICSSSSNSNVGITKNGGITIRKTVEQIRKETIEKLMGSD